MTSEVSGLNIDELKESGFTSIYKANNQDMVKNFIEEWHNLYDTIRGATFKLKSKYKSH